MSGIYKTGKPAIYQCSVADLHCSWKKSISTSIVKMIC